VLDPGVGKTSASGYVQFLGPWINEGSYELKDVQSAVFNIKPAGSTHPAWLCQSGPGMQALGGLKLLISSVRRQGLSGPTNFMDIHGVFEALLIPTDSGVSGNVVLHGEF
jgi:hypothetical protein